ncbi:MAG: hypothetical protein F6K40_24910 [Okeania sp. SIO3I5]|nr:hypothetical protein [Okeania sp. SIO3I5]
MDEEASITDYHPLSEGAQEVWEQHLIKRQPTEVAQASVGISTPNSWGGCQIINSTT